MSVSRFRCVGLIGVSIISLLAGQPAFAATAAPPDNLQKVAHFNHEVTGVTVAKDGRIFVNFPRWTEDAPVSVAELGKDGKLTPYPDAEWNAWRKSAKSKLTPQTHFICVQSVVADGHGNLWVVDPAAPSLGKAVSGGQKLVKIDLATNKATQTILFNDKVAPDGSYANDVRISPDGATAYLTDSGKGAIIVVDLQSGEARRVLDGDKSTQFEPGVDIIIDGKPLRKPDGSAPHLNADGIALSPDGTYLYYQALTGKTLYRVPTDALRDKNETPSDLSGKVEKVVESGPADGLWMDEKGSLYAGDPQNNAVRYIDQLYGNFSNGPRGSDAMDLLVQDKRLRWPDTFSEGPDGALYVTSSHLEDSRMFKKHAPAAVKTELWKIVPKAK